MQWWDANRAPVNRLCWVQLLAGESGPIVLGANSHCFRIKPNTRADHEGWDSILFGDLINVDPRNGEKGGSCAAVNARPKSMGASPAWPRGLFLPDG